MKKNLILIIILFSFVNSNAQSSWEEIISTKVPAELRISSDLFQAAKMYEIDRKAALQKLPNELYRSHQGKLILNITTGPNADIEVDRKYLQNLGIHVDGVYKNSAEVHIAIEDLLTVASKLEAPYVLRSYACNTSDNEGPGLTNVSTYNAAGKRGQGIKVGIIDVGFVGLTAAVNAGVAPASTTRYNYTPNGFEVGTTAHGVGCVEMVFDYAPQATYYLYKVDSEADMGLVVTQAEADGVQILGRSTTFFNQGWADGSGTINASVKDATDAGMIWLNGSGNFNGEHYENTWFDNDGDDIFNFTSTDERVNFVIPQTNTNQTNRVSVSMQWLGTPSSLNDYDIEVYDANTNALLGSGNSSTDFESFSLTNFTGANLPAYAIIKKMGSLSRPFEFFIRGIVGNLEYFNDGSTATPANSLEDRAITVGVVNQQNYNQTNPALEAFCSRGPTNGGRIVPDIAAMDGCTALSYPNSFLGASAGGPNVMGLLAAFWSEHTYLSQDELLEIIFKLASNYKDWGDPGMDNSYGHGGVFLPSYKPNSRFIYKALNNVNSDQDGPFIDMSQADDLVDQNSNLYFLGETFNTSTSGSTIVNKPNVYRSVQNNSYIKQ